MGCTMQTLGTGVDWGSVARYRLGMPPTRLPQSLRWKAERAAYAPRCKGCGCRMIHLTNVEERPDFCQPCVVRMWATIWSNINPF